jgi:DNA-binding response OmpR family regulator
MQIPERVSIRTHLLQRVWGFDFDPATNVVDSSQDGRSWGD